MTEETWQRRPDGINAGWRYTIRLHQDPDQAYDDPVALAGLVVAARAVVQAARDYTAVGPRGDELRGIAAALDDIQTVDEFDDVWEELYDWGDQYRVIIRLD